MRGERNEVRERVWRAMAAPVAESEKLLADLRDADADTRLSILVSGWFRGVAAALEELAIALDDLLARPAAEPAAAPAPAEPGVEPPAPASPAETSGPVDLSDANAEQLIDTARQSREEAAKLRHETEQARRRLER